MNYRHLSDRIKNDRINTCSWLCFIGLVLTYFSLMMFPKPQITQAIYIALVVLPFFSLAPKTLGKAWKQSILFRWILALLAFCFASLFWGEKIADSEAVFDFFRHTVYTLALIGGIMLSIPLVKKHQTMLWIVFLSCSIAAASSLGQFFADLSPASRLTHFCQYKHPNMTAQLYGLAALSLMAVIPKKWSKFFQLATAIGLSFIFTAIFFTSSRAGILGITLATGIFVLVTRDRRIWIPTTALFIAVTIYVGTAYRLGQQSDENGRRPLVSMSYLIERKSSGRILIWKELIARMEPHEYIAGKGLRADEANSGNPEIFVHAHSVPLSTFFHGGVIALFMHIGIFIWVLRKGYTEQQRNNISIALIASFGLFTSLFDGGNIIGFTTKFQPYLLFFWLPVALAAAADIGQTFLSKPLIKE